MHTIIIVNDSREKLPWDFSLYGFKQECICLNAGDYIIKDSNLIVIEKKGSVSELAINLGKNKRQFEAELERMQSFKYRYILCEFSLEDLMIFPRKSGIPKKRWKWLKINSKFMIKTLEELCNEYNIGLIFCNSRQEAEQRASELISEASNTSR